MTGTIFLGGTARRKSSGARSQVCRNVSGPTRPVVQSFGGLTGLGPGPPRSWGPGLSLPPVFRRSEKSPGRAGEGVGDGLGPAPRGLGSGAWGRGPGHQSGLAELATNFSSF